MLRLCLIFWKSLTFIEEEKIFTDPFFLFDRIGYGESSGNKNIFKGGLRDRNKFDVIYSYLAKLTPGS